MGQFLLQVSKKNTHCNSMMLRKLEGNEKEGCWRAIAFDERSLNYSHIPNNRAPELPITEKTLISRKSTNLSPRVMAIKDSCPNQRPPTRSSNPIFKIANQPGELFTTSISNSARPHPPHKTMWVQLLLRINNPHTLARIKQTSKIVKDLKS